MTNTIRFLKKTKMKLLLQYQNQCKQRFWLKSWPCLLHTLKCYLELVLQPWLFHLDDRNNYYIKTVIMF